MPRSHEAEVERIRAAAGANGDAGFDIKAALQAIATDTTIAATPRISALRLLREIAIAEENAAFNREAGLP